MIIVMDNLNAAKPGEARRSIARGIADAGSPSAPAGARRPPRADARAGPGRGAAGFAGKQVFTETMLTDLIPDGGTDAPRGPRDARTARWPACRWAARRRSAPRSPTSTSSPISAVSAAAAAAAADSIRSCERRRLCRRGSIQQESEAPVPGHRLGRRRRNEDVQRPADARPASRTSIRSPGTAHEWLTWRRCLKEFAPLLFR